MKGILGIIKKKNIPFINVLGLTGLCLWTLAVFLRETTIMQNEFASFSLGIAPNFGVGLLLPTLIVIYYPLLLKKDLTLNKFILIVIAIYILLLVSEVIHYKLLNSGFDIYDMIASLIALWIMILSYKYKKVSN